MGPGKVLLFISLAGGIVVAGVLMWTAANVEKKVISKVGLFTVATILLFMIDLLYNMAVNKEIIKSLW